VKNKLYTVVSPFFVFASISFLVAMILLVIHSDLFLGFYIQPNIIAITHILILGWATMIILGCCYQLIPFINHVDLYSYRLAYASFILLAVGIPILIYAFFSLNFDDVSIIASICINVSVWLILFNLYKTVRVIEIYNIQSIYILVSIIWLLITVSVGLLMIINFKFSFLPLHSLEFLSVHLHVGVGGWFLLLIIGVSSRLFPMFLVSNYLNDTLLKCILIAINIALISYLLGYANIIPSYFNVLSVTIFAAAIFSYVYFCGMVYINRFHAKNTMLLDLSGVSLVFLIVSVLIFCLLFFVSSFNLKLIKLFSSTIFLGWITALILQMTFKILPYIVWTMKYSKSMNGIPYSPLLLFEKKIFDAMTYFYLVSMLFFIPGIIFNWSIVIKCGSFFLFVTALLYNYNVFKILFYKPKMIVHETN
jgi:hypothetical protein